MSAPSLYQQVLGAQYALLPAPLQRFHALGGRHELAGWVEVLAPANAAARAVARLLGTPLAAARGPIHFELEAGPTGERWVRRFPARTMESRLGIRSGRLVERLGPVQLSFTLRAGPEKLEMRLAGLRALGVPCPRWLLPAIVAEETASPGRLHFRVHAALPLVGRIAGYQGHLEIPREDDDGRGV